MKSSDLSTLIPPPSQKGSLLASSGIVQGTITSFNTATGANTVQVGQSVLTNVSMLMTSVETDYSAGDHVLLIVLGTTYTILGKIAAVGSPQFASASIANASTYASTSGFALTTTSTTLVSATIAVPVWADYAAITMIAGLEIVSSSSIGGAAAIALDVWNDGAYHPGQLQNFMYGSGAGASVTNAMTISRSVTPGGTLSFTGAGNWATASPPASVAVSQCDLSATAIFTKQ